MKIIYDANLMKSMILFENLTKVNVKDAYLRENSIWFVIEKGGMFRAIGKNGIKIKKVENVFKKKVKLIEENEDIKIFCKGLIYPVKAKEIDFNDEILTITAEDTRAKGLLIGRERKNLNELKEVLSRYFELKDVEIK